MHNAIVLCEGDAVCKDRTDTTVTYRHSHGPLSRQWIQPGVGPTPTGVPHPQPCPDDGVSCSAVKIKCNSCGWTKNY
jgi:hypothetical protein